MLVATEQQEVRATSTQSRERHRLLYFENALFSPFLVIFTSRRAELLTWSCTAKPCSVAVQRRSRHTACGRPAAQELRPIIF